MKGHKFIYVVSDVHGDFQGLQAALIETGLLVLKPGRGLVKVRDRFVVQIGDLANCVRESRDDDLRCLETVGEWIDLMLVGNHEVPYFDAENTFAGFHSYGEIHQKLWDLYEAGLLLPSYCGGSDWLITHAGITLSQLDLSTGQTPSSVDAALRHIWSEKNFGHHLFRDCGWARHGKNRIGGILWCDFDREFEPTEFTQIVGHTSGVIRPKGTALCIDSQRTNGGKPAVVRLMI